jgi:dethiobiotin synthetase
VKAYFVTGTDTGVGKTFVSAGILHSLRRRGVRTAALKPAETGCDPDPADGLLLARAAGTCLVPFTYRLPVAPAVAGRVEGNPFTLPPVRAAFDGLDADFCLVEGAGGLLVPFADGVLVAHIAAALGLPLLIVARASLGTINHTLLTVLAARERGLVVAGVILNRVFDTLGPDEPYNIGEIKRYARVEVLGTVPHTPPPHDPARCADAVERAFDPTSLR